MVIHGDDFTTLGDDNDLHFFGNQMEGELRVDSQGPSGAGREG